MVAITQPRLIAAPVRLPEVVYRRRRLLALGLALVLAALAFASASVLGSAPAGFRSSPAANVTYVVEPGDSVWSIAEALAPGRDPRSLVDTIVEANGGADLMVGQQLVLELP